jgi:hypothetical protein
MTCALQHSSRNDAMQPSERNSCCDTMDSRSSYGDVRWPHGSLLWRARRGGHHGISCALEEQRMTLCERGGTRACRAQVVSVATAHAQGSDVAREQSSRWRDEDREGRTGVARRTTRKSRG